MKAAEKAALAAFASPIHIHARAWAAAVIASIERDVAARESIDIADGLSDVVPLDELDNSLALKELAGALYLPDGAGEWAKTEWTVAFMHELERLAKERRTAVRAQGREFMRRHLRELEAHR